MSKTSSDIIGQDVLHAAHAFAAIEALKGSPRGKLLEAEKKLKEEARRYYKQVRVEVGQEDPEEDEK